MRPSAQCQAARWHRSTKIRVLAGLIGVSVRHDVSMVIGGGAGRLICSTMSMRPR